MSKLREPDVETLITSDVFPAISTKMNVEITANKYYKALLNKEKEIHRNGMHSFHRYFGKLIPAIPGFAIKNFTKEGDYVLDSFSGSGTSLLEAKNLNRNAFGVDINPLATFISKVKTTKIDRKIVEQTWEKLQKKIDTDKSKLSTKSEFYCINIDHWFKDFAKKDLLRLRKNILELPEGDVRDFFLASFSAFLRGVSNADPRHVFPGYSKRLRKLDAEGKRKIDVKASFTRTIKRRLDYLDALPVNRAKIKAIEGDSRDLPKEIRGIDLIVVNPPYISSIRYLETLKIEMGWLGFIGNQKEYLSLDTKLVGTERFYKKDLEDTMLTGFPKLDKQIFQLKRDGQHKMAKVVSQYFNDMRKSMSEMNRVLKKNGHLVMKISDSTVRNEKIKTHEHFLQIAEDLNLKSIACFKDSFDENSRSLLTSRNSYSGIMNHDWILIFRKEE
ncbi:MAG: DNA methyltransferase [Candidatus Adlerbacteria bacterium]|nr:DNA methyltransferase [Candidatus Adlerbacteria bacterium]